MHSEQFEAESESLSMISGTFLADTLLTPDIQDSRDLLSYVQQKQVVYSQYNNILTLLFLQSPIKS